MKVETKEEITEVLELLKHTLMKNGVSIAVDKKVGNLIFFDTSEYLQSKRMTGMKVDVQSLVK